MRRWIVCGTALLLSVRAEAVDAYMWGIGPHLGTMVVPAQFPSTFPPAVVDDPGSTANRIGGDLDLGVDAIYYANRTTRVGISGALDVAPNYNDIRILLRYNLVNSTDAMDILVGGAVGAGTMRFDWEGNQLLRVPYYPLRGEVSALIRDGVRAYQLTPYAQYNLPSNHFYTSVSGEEVDVGTGIYAMIGVEASILFGDFTPPRAKRN
jgi:hypothetical protein